MKTPEQEPTYKVTVVDDQHPNGIPLEQWTPEDMAYRPGALVRTEPDPTPKQLAALGWQSIECPFCGTSGAQAFPKPDLTDADRKSYQAGHNAGVAHHKQAIKREWVGLTDGKIDAVTTAQWGVMSGQPLAAHRAYARATEAKLKELNHD